MKKMKRPFTRLVAGYLVLAMCVMGMAPGGLRRNGVLGDHPLSRGGEDCRPCENPKSDGDKNNQGEAREAGLYSERKPGKTRKAQ